MKEMFRRRRLPHWDLPGATYFVTTCLEGSTPAEGLLDIATFRDELANRCRPDHISESDWKIYCWKLTFGRCEEWLDKRPAVRHFADPALAKIVVDAMYHFAGERYDILAYVVMPSHIHWVFTPRREWAESLTDERSPREIVMHSLKRHTSMECNRRLDLTGAFWQRESYDHCVCDVDELERIIDYVELNPVKARLAASRELWLFSSAYDRKRFNIPIGTALRRADKSL